MHTGFTQEQIRELKSIGLSPEQTDELANHALPSMGAYLRKQPAKGEVVAELDSALTALQRAENAIHRLLRGSTAPQSQAREVPPSDAALARVLVASFDMGADGYVLDKALPPLSAAIRVIELAIRTLPSPPTRHRTALYFPVQLVDKALVSGFLKASGHWPGLSGPNASQPVPPYPIERSYGEGSDYRRIVEICYEAAGAGAGSRERPIREFLRLERRRTEPPKKT